MSLVDADADQRCGGGRDILAPRDVILHCAELLVTKSRRPISVRGTVVYVDPASKRVDIVHHGAKLIIRMTTTTTMLPPTVLPASSSPSPILQTKNNHVPNDNDTNTNTVLPSTGRSSTDIVNHSLDNTTTNHTNSISLSNNNSNADNDGNADANRLVSSSSSQPVVASSRFLNCLPKLHSEIIVTGILGKEQRRIFLMATTAEVVFFTPTNAVTT